MTNTPMSYENWLGTEECITALLNYYDVDEEYELADCNISENDTIDLYNNVYLNKFRKGV